MPSKEEAKAIPLGIPHKINGEWFYRTKHSIWASRVTDDLQWFPVVAKKPVWVRVNDNYFTD